MSENGDGGKEPLTQQRAEALGAALASSLGTATQMWERQMATLLGLAAIVAAMPQTADVDLKKVGAAIQLMAGRQSNPEKLRDEMTRTASMIINLSRRLREIDPADEVPPAASDSAGSPAGAAD